MNQQLQTILDIIQQNENLTAEEKDILIKSVNKVENDLSISEFKLERTEKVKRTTAILLEETIAELENKRKAVEAQNHELEIEASLERVRTVAMGMTKPDDLLSICKIQFHELKKLGFTEMRNALIGIYHDEEKYFTDYDYSDYAGGNIHKIPYNKNSLVDSSMMRMKSATDAFTEFVVEGDKLQEWKTFRKQNNEYDDTRIENIDALYYYFYSINSGNIGISTFKKISEEQLTILRRFRNVFDLAYKRYVDISNAEAQAREAKIEASLERVRSRSMAMHKTDELLDAAELLYKELTGLGITSMAVTYSIMDEEEKNAFYYSINPVDGKIPTFPFVFSHAETEVMRSILASWKKQESFNVIELDEEATLKHQTWVGEKIQTFITENKISIPFSVEAFLAVSPKKAVIYTFNFKQGYVFIIGGIRLTKDQEEMLLRFTKVFEMTYRRFLDLQKAEAQAKEAQIEASLERVRSKTMAMHNSNDVGETVATMFAEFVHLGIHTNRCGILIFRDETFSEVWTAKANPEGKSSLVIGGLNLTMHRLLSSLYKAWKAGDTFYQDHLIGDDLVKYYQSINDQKDYPIKFDLKALPSKEYFTDFFFPEGTVFAFTNEPIAEEHAKIFKRFAAVFGQTYRRYLDLQKAEEQTREARIEAAMEKVRARAMAMQKPEELVEVAQVLRKEMGLLGVEELETSSIYIHHEESGKTECWYAIQDKEEKKLVADHMVIDLNDTWVGREMLAFYRSDEKQISIPMKGENRKEWINYCSEHSKLLQGFYGEVIPERTYHLYKFSNGYMGAASPNDISAESWNLLQRATSVFSLAYTRFSDLQIAEASTKEAIKQAALDRIRADIASMRTISDLDRITPLIWNELTILGIPFIRCGVFIMDDSQQLIHTFLSTPDGKAIAAFHLPYDTPGNISLVLSHWQKKEKYSDRWDEAEFNQFAEILVKQGALVSAENYLKTIPHGGFYLHFLPFLQGMLYVGNTTQLSEEEINLIQSVADAFSTAYARYEDFNKLEAAKQQVDKTLVDLKQAQQQLVQSEKMASLGELTAGIAHEIQNPLNFVNNFSEVSKELLDEMKTELDKGNADDAKELADDVIQNLEKINHHGKRADAIVKGMLQHSRSSSAVKEPTDINALCDEYLRLSYHGLRAKDKSFNAKFETDFDPSLEKVNVIAQDMGRVILNLLTNAFYAVTEKKKQHPEGYEPAVTVKTSKNPPSGGRGAEVLISVADNGNGIPQKILDKIFQPFFTTKPTGQGTGLGLSLSYDIIKAHGGEIKVETKEGEGTKFIIQLPIT